MPALDSLCAKASLATKLSIGSDMSDWTLHRVTSFAQHILFLESTNKFKHEEICETELAKFFVDEEVKYCRSLHYSCCMRLLCELQIKLLKKSTPRRVCLMFKASSCVSE